MNLWGENITDILAENPEMFMGNGKLRSSNFPQAGILVFIVIIKALTVDPKWFYQWMQYFNGAGKKLKQNNLKVNTVTFINMSCGVV